MKRQKVKCNDRRNEICEDGPKSYKYIEISDRRIEAGVVLAQEQE
jgi:hypothetical protein